VSHRGRFGKYGDIKRIDRLRKAGIRTRPFSEQSKDRKPPSIAKSRLVVRRANLSDIAFIGQLSGRVFSVYGPYRGLVSQWFESGSTITIIAVQRGRPVGFAMMGRLFDGLQEENRCELLAIAVDPGAQRQGIGRMLLQKIEEEAERLREPILFLHTAIENLPAQQLFKKDGFRPVALKKLFYPAGQDALMMIKAVPGKQNPGPLGFQG
jgi:ribosomal protein S18 acetylase RimI-like enzyme